MRIETVRGHAPPTEPLEPMNACMKRGPVAMDYFWAAAAIVLAVAGMSASATAAEPSKADQQCLACHGMPGLEKPLANGETLPLHVAGDSFAQSVHAGLGCTGC